MLLLRHHMLGLEKDIHGLYLYIGSETSSKVHQWKHIPILSSMLIPVTYHMIRQPMTTTTTDHSVRWSYVKEDMVPNMIPLEINTIILILSIFIGVVIILMVCFGYSKNLKQQTTVNEESLSYNTDKKTLL
jgi:hypothetical protein